MITESKVLKGYVVTSKCVGCKTCSDVCSAQCINIKRKPVYIDQEKCLKCGSCYKICEYGAIAKIQ